MSGNEIEIKVLVKRVWLSKRIIIRNVFCFAILGVLIALSLKNKFTAGSVFIPQSAEGAKLPSGIGGLASLAGIQIGGASGGGGIPAKIYPKILNSPSFQLELLDSEISIEGAKEKVTYRNFYDNYYRKSLFQHISDYTVGLPGLIIKAIKGEEESNELGEEGQSYISVSPTDLIHIKRLRSQILITINEDEGFVNLSFTMDDPLRAAEMATNVETLLQKRLIEYKIENSTVQLDYIQSEYDKKSEEFKDVQEKLATFRDTHTGLTTATAQSELVELESEYNLVLGVYNELAKQLVQAKMQVSKDTPVFSILDPISIPSEKSGPKRAFLVLGFLILGVVFGVLEILFKPTVKEFLFFMKK